MASARILTQLVILSLPSFLESSAGFAYSACVCHLYFTPTHHDRKKTNSYGLCKFMYMLVRFDLCLKPDRIMAQLTLSRFRGDTAFGFVTRIISTFVGGIIGTVMWCVFRRSRKLNAG